MPGVYLFLQLSFAIQKIIQFHSDLRGGSKIEKVDQGAPLSPTGAVIKSIWSYSTLGPWTPEYIRGQKMSPHEFTHFYITCHLVGLHL